MGYKQFWVKMNELNPNNVFCCGVCDEDCDNSPPLGFESLAIHDFFDRVTEFFYLKMCISELETTSYIYRQSFDLNLSTQSTAHSNLAEICATTWILDILEVERPCFYAKINYIVFCAALRKDDSTLFFSNFVL